MGGPEFDLNQALLAWSMHSRFPMGTWESADLVLSGAALLVASYALLRWRRAIRILGTRVLIREAMKRRGITPVDAEAAGLDAELLAAEARCGGCTADLACRVMLSEPGRGELPATCPNRHFFERIEQHKTVASAARTFAAWR